MNTLWNDVRFALRVLAKNPVFTAVAVITLALGIGANTAIFSAMNAVLLRSLPVKNADRLVWLRFQNQPRDTSQTGYGDRSLSEPTFEHLRAQREVFADLVAFVPLSFSKSIVRLGVEPQGSTDLWIPFQTLPELKPWGVSPQDKSALYGSPDWWFLMMIGRLRPGVNKERALAQLQPAYQSTAYLGTSGPRKDEPRPQLYFSSVQGIAGLREAFETPLRALMATVGLVLVIACSNVAMLLVARNSTRQREFSLRSALGAGRVRLFRQLLTEGLLLAAAGGTAGWLLALWASDVLARWARLDASLAPDRGVLFFSVVICLGTASIFGLVPFWSVGRVPLWVALRTSGSSATQDRTGFRAGQ